VTFRDEPVGPRSCPVCASPGDVTETEHRERHLGKWFCSRCRLLFNGGPGEWAHYTIQRESLARRKGAGE
jgi:hypothetical protein